MSKFWQTVRACFTNPWINIKIIGLYLKGERLHSDGNLELATLMFQEALGLFQKVSDEAISQNLRVSLLGRLASTLHELSDYAGSEKARLEALKRIRDSPTDEDQQSTLAMQLSNYGNMLTAANENEKADLAYQEAIDIRRQLVKDYGDFFKPKLAISLVAYGKLLDIMHMPELAMSKFSEAESLLEESSLRASEKLDILARIFSGMADAEQSLGDLNSSHMHTCRELEVRIQLNDQTAIAECWQRLGVFEESMGDVRTAIGSTCKAIEILRELVPISPGNYRPRLARCLNNLGNCFGTLFEFDKAEVAFKECVSIRRELAGSLLKAHGDDLASSLSNYSIIKKNQGNLVDAATLIEEAIGLIQLAQSNIEQSNKARILHNAGTIYCESNDFDRGLACLAEAERIRRELYRETPGIFANKYGLTLGALATAYSAVGDHEAARIAYEKAIGVFQLLAKPNIDGARELLATNLCQFGNILSLLGDARGAYRAYDESVILFEELHRTDKKQFADGYAFSLFNFGSFQAELGHHDSARKLLESAQDIYQWLCNSGENKPFANLASTQHHLGKLLLVDGEIADAIDLLKVSAVTFQELLTIEPNGWLEIAFLVYCDLGLSYAELHRQTCVKADLEKAIEWLEKGADVGGEFRFRFIELSQRRKITEDHLSPMSQALVDCYFQMLEFDSNELVWLEKAILASEKFRARALVDLMDGKRTPRNTPTEVVADYQRKRSELMNFAQLIHEANSQKMYRNPSSMPQAGGRSSSDLNGVDLNIHRDSLKNYYYAALEIYKKSLLFIQNEYDPDFDPDGQSDAVTIEQIQARLADSQREIVQFTTTSRATYAAIISSNRLTGLTFLAYCDEAMSEFGRNWFATMKEEEDKESLGRWGDKIDQLLLPISDHLLNPICSELEPTTQYLTVIPNQVTSVLPLGLCAIEDGQRICDKYAMSFAQCLALLTRSPSEKETGDYLVQVSQLVDDRPFISMEAKSVASHVNGLIRMSFELDEIPQIIDATKNAEIWHYSGHASFSVEQPLESFLGGTARVSVRDIATRFDCSKTSLVFLSACQTGVFLPDPLDEYIGIVPAFICTGAKNTIGSLWEAQDMPAWLFADRFYFNISSGLAIDNAFNEAQKWLRGIVDHKGESLDTKGALNRHLDHLREKNVISDADLKTCQIESGLWGEDDNFAPFHGPADWGCFVLTKSTL